MEDEKSAMWRVPASLVRLVDAVAVEIDADPTLRAEAGTKAGKVTRAGVLRLLISRGATSMQGTIRERKKLEAATTTKPATKPKNVLRK
jgi:hypothetical protein